MPQFDKLTFCTQLFWVISFFLFFYMQTVRKYLPLFIGLLKLRNKRISLTFIEKLEEEPKQTKSLNKQYYQSFIDYAFLNGTKLSKKISKNLAKETTFLKRNLVDFSNTTFLLFYRKGENQKNFLQ